MKCKLLIIPTFLFISSFGGSSVSAQNKKPVAKSASQSARDNKPRVIEIEATTKDGKAVILKSDKTWDYSNKPIIPELISEIQPCTLLLKDLPAVRDLKPGMQEQEFLDLFAIDAVKQGYVFNKTNTEGVLRANIVTFMGSNRLYQVPLSFSGITTLEIKTYAGKVFFLEFRYEPAEMKFATNNQFAESVSKSLNFPANSWIYNAIDGSLTCKEFKVAVNVLSRTLTLTDLTTEQRINESEELKRKGFKP